MKTLLFLDVESTGLDETTDHVIEVGWALWSVELRTMTSCGSMLVNNGITENRAEGINGIPAPVLSSGESWIEAQRRVVALQSGADATVAHNAAFDRKWFHNDIQSHRWICSKSDIEWPLAIRGKASLVDIALAHGVGITHAHRAISDVLTLVRLFERVAERWDIQKLLSDAVRPKKLYRALVSYDAREMAKQAGFEWDSTKKQWIKALAQEDAQTLPFSVQEVA